jgi:predicted phage tail protein
VSGSSLALSWTAPSSGAAPAWYVIEAGSFSGSRDFVQSTGSVGTTFTADGVGAGTYFVRVRAASAAGESAASNEVIVVVGGRTRTAPRTGSPAAPTGLVTAVSGSTVTFAWNAPTTGGTPRTYRLDAGSSVGQSDLASFSTGNTATSVTVPGVPAGTYYVRVRTVNEFGTSGASNEVVAFVSGASSACSAPPSAPGALRFTTRGSTVTLGWNGAGGAPTSYIVEAGSQPASADLVVTDSGGTATSMIATGVGRGTYFVRVRARNACGTSSPSNEVAIVVQ